MESTSCPRMLHSQPTGSTEIVDTMNIQCLYECFINLCCYMSVFVSPVPNKCVRESISLLCSLCLMLYILPLHFVHFNSNLPPSR